MIIVEEQELFPIYCYSEYDGARFMLTESGYITETYANQYEVIGEIPKIHEKVIKGKVSKFYSCVPEITRDIFMKIIGEDYANNEEKERYKQQIDEIKPLLPGYSREILKEYYIYKIKKGEFELWKNNFKDNIFEVAKNQMYIDDEIFEIFYFINEEGKYTFEFIEK